MDLKHIRSQLIEIRPCGSDVIPIFGKYREARGESGTQNQYTIYVVTHSLTGGRSDPPPLVNEGANRRDGKPANSKTRRLKLHLETARFAVFFREADLFREGGVILQTDVD